MSRDGNQSTHPESRSRLLAAFLSALLPGAGQWYAGRRTRGAWFAGVTLAAVLIAAYVVLRDPLVTFRLAFSPTVLTSLLVVDAVVLGWRIFAAVDAYRLAEGSPHLGRSTRVIALTAIGAVLVVPHAVFAYYDLIQHDLITSVFATGQSTTTAPSTSAAPVTTTAPPDSTTSAPGDAPPATSEATTTTTTEAPSTTTAAPPLWQGQDRLNLLLLGSDAGVGRTGVRTDTMAVVSIDPDSGDAAVFGIPRNFHSVPLPESVGIWRCNCFPNILNELYDFGERRPDAFPGTATSGANAIKSGVSELLGIPIHYYALVSLDGFVDVIDAFDGIDITVTERLYDPGYPNEDGTESVVDLQPGEYHFDGHEALIYARVRYSSDDYDRMARQRCVLEALASQADPITVLRNFPTIAAAIERSLETDIPLDRVPDLIDLLPLVDTERVVSIGLVPPTYIRGRTSEGYPYPNLERIRADVATAVSLPALEAIEVLGLEPLADACG